MRRGLFRIWVVLTTIWIVSAAVYLKDDLTADTWVPGTKLFEFRDQRGKFNVFARDESGAEKLRDQFLGEWFHYKGVWKIEDVIRLDEVTPYWDVRLKALAWVLVPPILILLIDLVMCWIIAGFKTGEERD